MWDPQPQSPRGGHNCWKPKGESKWVGNLFSSGAAIFTCKPGSIGAPDETPGRAAGFSVTRRPLAAQALLEEAESQADLFEAAEFFNRHTCPEAGE
jgi:hypothetical protein